MSMALAVVDKAMVVVELDPNILFVTEGKVNVLPPVPSCFTTNVP